MSKWTIATKNYGDIPIEDAVDEADARKQAQRMIENGQVQRADAPGVTTADSTWGETGTNFVNNIKPSFQKMGTDIMDMVRHPVDTAYGAGRFVQGASEYANPFISPFAIAEDTGVAKASEPGSWGEWRAQNRGMVQDAVTDTAKSLWSPAVTVSNNPAGAATALAGGLVGKVAKTALGARAVAKAGTAASKVPGILDEIVSASQKAKEAAYGAVDTHPTEIFSHPIVRRAVEDAYKAGYDVGAPGHAPMHEPTIKYLEGKGASPESTMTLKEIQAMRGIAADVNPEQVRKFGTTDNRIRGAMREGIDASLATADPEAAGLLRGADKLNTQYKNIKRLDELVKSSAAKSTEQKGNFAGRFQTETGKLLDNPAEMKGVEPGTEAFLRSVREMPASTGILAKLAQTLPAAGTVLGSVGLGPLGGVLGYMASTPAMQGLISRGGRKASKAMIKAIKAHAESVARR
jgi:hypothetical protein